jgi:DNA topoisomerase-2
MVHISSPQDFKEYIDLYIKSKSSDNNESGLTSNKAVIYDSDKTRWEVAFVVSDGQFQQVSFVNNICTTKGGTHVNYSNLYNI